jgi:hypothetical protein
MGVNVLDGRTFNGVTVSVALLGLIIAAVALFYGRRAVFPPRRRVTLFVHAARIAPAESANRGLHARIVTVRNTGRHAIESSRFDRERPLTVDLGAPLRQARTVAAPRPEMRIQVRGSAIEFGPELLNPGESITAEVFADHAVARSSGAASSGHVLIDTVVEVRWKRPPGPLRRRAPRVALALPLIYLLAIGWANGRYDALNYFTAGPTASISPDHGPSRGCVTIRGKGFGIDEGIEIVSYDFPAEARAGYPAPAGCPALKDGRGQTRSSVKGEVYFAFALPPGCSGQLTIWVDGDRYDAVTYWVT